MGALESSPVGESGADGDDRGGAVTFGQLLIITAAEPSLVYLHDLGGKLAAEKLGFGPHWQGNAKIGISRAALRRLVVTEAQHDADRALQFKTGTSLENWLGSEAEVITRTLEPRARREHQDLYLETFRARVAP